MPRLADIDTREVHLIGVIRKKVHDQPFALLFQHALLDLITGTGRSLTALEWRVLLHLIATADYPNTVDQHVTEIAHRLGHHYTAVSRALAALGARELIQRQNCGGGRPRRILLDPTLVFRGDAAQRAAALRDYYPDPQDEPHRGRTEERCSPDPVADSASA